MSATSNTRPKAQVNHKDQAEIHREIRTGIVNNVSYDNGKAAKPKDARIPDSDETLRSSTGICFDFADPARIGAKTRKGARRSGPLLLQGL